ncbi:TPA: MnhB domain-containing protein [Campylobacter jejuni]|nr:MnhB domain-containing protein [Campylobacter jejuni]HDZ5099406.1 MnhB domain-containing protein [Campylobacter jejuni]HDZ5102803.1 MnhB domain-containing protein [Campylobacter jejuni]HDZ5104470.1 MnhB domain-containing protein [Campylobacter jejuni]HDZ5109433.1 MnhB domain-containing protein [Campylobacter jejuni]
MKKSQKQKTPNPIKQENQNKEIPPQTFNTQLNFLMENELNAIGKLPKDLADRIVTMLEKSLEYKKDNDNKILDLENKNIEIRKKDIKSYHFWNGFGMVSFLLITIISIGVGLYLILNGHNEGGYFAFILGVLALSPKIIDSIKNKPKN